MTSAMQPPNHCALDDVRRERIEQLLRYGDEIDDQHRSGELIDAAICYATHARAECRLPNASALSEASTWPFEIGAWHPSDARHDLVRAAALLVAEIGRLDRAVVQGRARTTARAECVAAHHA